MRCCWMVLKHKDVGSIGIGAMIVFIAMVLVAGIAASVLIQTSTKLETQAMQSGQETIAEVAGGVAIEQILGHKNSGEAKIDYIAIQVRPRAGSTAIDLSELVVEISDTSEKNLLSYHSGIFTDSDGVNGRLFTATFFSDQAQVFTVIVVEDADDSIASGTPVINHGDHVMLAVNVSSCFNSLDPRDDVFGLVIPEEGSPGVISFTCPQTFNVPVIELQ